MSTEHGPSMYYDTARSFGFSETYLDRMNDSEVRVMIDGKTNEHKYVKKIYEVLATKLEYSTKLSEEETLKLVEGIVRQYIQDTKKVVEFEQNNPTEFTHTITLSGRSYGLRVHIIPQGEIILRESGTVGVLGQDFITGSHLSRLADAADGAPLMKDELLPIAITTDDIHAIEKSLAETVVRINEKMGRNFEITRPNVILRYDADTSTFFADVTDLANRMVVTYKDMYSQYLPQRPSI